jgi:PmbA protein
MASIESLASAALKKAEKIGASQAEAFTMRTHGRSVYVESSKPRVAEDKLETGLGLKICLGKRIGYSSGTVNETKDVEEVVKEAFAIAKTNEEDPYFKSFPTATKLSGKIQNAYSESTAHIGLDDMVHNAMVAVKSAENTKNVRVPLGLIRIADYELQLVNSLGVDFNHKASMVFSYFKSKASVGDNAGEGIEKEWSTDISRIDFEGMGKSIAEKAIATMQAESFKGKSELTAIIVPTELEGFFMPIMLATSAEQVNKRRSPWANQLGNKVADDKLTIHDDGRYPGGIRSALADDEGVETSRKAIVEKGRLSAFIYDSYNAGISNVRATGNGFRRGTRSMEGAFARPAACSYANMVVTPGNKKLSELIASIGKGVLIEGFASPEVNQYTGGFGCEVRDATLIEGGQMTKHVRHALLTGNIFEALKNIHDVTSETKIVENTVLPSMAFSNVTLIGQT